MCCCLLRNSTGDIEGEEREAGEFARPHGISFCGYLIMHHVHVLWYTLYTIYCTVLLLLRCSDHVNVSKEFNFNASKVGKLFKF